MSGSALSLSTAGDLSQAAYQNLENGSTIDGYILVVWPLKSGPRLM